MVYYPERVLLIPVSRRRFLEPDDGAVALVARVLIELRVRLLCDRETHRKRRRSRRRILDANTVVDHLRFDSREPLGQLQLIAVGT